MDKDDNGKFRFERVKLKLICLNYIIIHFSLLLIIPEINTILSLLIHMITFSLDLWGLGLLREKVTCNVLMYIYTTRHAKRDYSRVKSVLFSR